MAYFDVELNMLDGLSVDSGGTGSLNRLWLDKIVLNGDTTDMVTAVVTRFNGSISYLTGTFNAQDLSTSYAVSYHNPRQQTDTEFVYLTVQTPTEINSDGLDDALIFRRFKFPDDLPINYQPQLDELDSRLDEAENILADHENRISKSEGIIAEHTSKIETLENRVDGHSNQIRELIHEVEGLTNDVHGLENSVESLENTVGGHSNQIREIIHELEGTINDVHGLENRVNSAENTLENHTTQINSNTTKINENKTKIAEHTDKIAVLESKNSVPLTVFKENENVNIDNLRTTGEYEIYSPSTGQRQGNFPTGLRGLYLKVIDTQSGSTTGGSVMQIAYVGTATGMGIYLRSYGQNWTSWRRIDEVIGGGDSADFSEISQFLQNTIFPISLSANVSGNVLTITQNVKRYGQGTPPTPLQATVTLPSNNGQTVYNSEYHIIKTFELPLLQDDDWGNTADISSDGWLTIWSGNKFIRNDLFLPWRQCGLSGAPTHINSEADRFEAMRRLKVDFNMYDRDDTIIYNFICPIFSAYILAERPPKIFLG